MMVVGGAAYGASKGALAAFTSGAALEFAPHAITVNTVLPGGAATPGAIHARGPAPEGPGHRASPFGLCDGRDLGAAVLYFASPAAAKVTNQQLAVDAGFSIA
jgi:NAD(P)-dependent dehydrogenase (short-subunit alcohol dehydrogenase family)